MPKRDRTLKYVILLERMKKLMLDFGFSSSLAPCLSLPSSLSSRVCVKGKEIGGKNKEER
jgi:hypothetical protein